MLREFSIIRPRSMRGPASSINTDRPASSICSAIRQPTIPVPAMTTSAPILLTMRTHLYYPQLERCIVVRGTHSCLAFPPVLADEGRRPCKSSRISTLQPQQLLSRYDAEIAQEIELVTVDILTQVCDCFVRHEAVRIHGVNAAGVQQGQRAGHSRPRNSVWRRFQ